MGAESHLGLCVCVCARTRACVCVCACVRACVHVCVRVGRGRSGDQCFQALDWKCAFKTAVCFPGNHHAALGVAGRTNRFVVIVVGVVIRQGKEEKKWKKGK